VEELLSVCEAPSQGRLCVKRLRRKIIITLIRSDDMIIQRLLQTYLRNHQTASTERDRMQTAVKIGRTTGPMSIIPPHQLAYRAKYSARIAVNIPLEGGVSK